MDDSPKEFGDKIEQEIDTTENRLRSRQKAKDVTDRPYFSSKISSNRNAGYGATDTTPDHCHWCRESFRPGQMRYPVATGVDHGGGWGLASVCMDCFKQADDEAASKLPRVQRLCEGCGEPMLTVVNARAWPWYICSNRCYQRVYRKRRRGIGSTVPWKGHAPSCQACRRPFKPKRADAKFCSAKCRQWHYRQRHRT
jgi:hypothetical protein